MLQQLRLQHRLFQELDRLLPAISELQYHQVLYKILPSPNNLLFHYFKPLTNGLAKEPGGLTRRAKAVMAMIVTKNGNELISSEFN